MRQFGATKTSPRTSNGAVAQVEITHSPAPLMVEKFPDFNLEWWQDTKHKWFDGFILLFRSVHNIGVDQT